MDNTVFKKYQHNPPHFLADEVYSMITSGAYKKIRLFDTDLKKKMLLNVIEEFLTQYNYQLLGWVVLNNHYHILIKSEKGKDIPEVFRKIHSKSAVLLNKMRTAEESYPPRVWSNYWDTWIRDEDSYYKRLNYIHINPVKHGYVEKLDGYEFSSYNYYAQKGEDWISNVLGRYSVDDVGVEDDF
jgi:putative transposase